VDHLPLYHSPARIVELEGDWEFCQSPLSFLVDRGKTTALPFFVPISPAARFAANR
jgi:hypothetical protein